MNPETQALTAAIDRLTEATASPDWLNICLTIFGGILVPIFALYFGIRVANRGDKQQGATDLFVRLHRGVQEFIYAFMKVRRSHDTLNNCPLSSDRTPNPIVVELRKQHQVLEHDLIERTAELENARMLLGLMFTPEDEPIGRTILGFSECAALILEEQTRQEFLNKFPADACFSNLNTQKNGITAEMKSLWQRHFGKVGIAKQ